MFLARRPPELNRIESRDEVSKTRNKDGISYPYSQLLRFIASAIVSPGRTPDNKTSNVNVSSSVRSVSSNRSSVGIHLHESGFYLGRGGIVAKK